MARYLSVAEAARLDKLSRLVRAATLVSELTTGQRKKITDDVAAVTLFAEAGRRSLAEPSLDRIVNAFTGTEFEEAVTAQVESVRTYWTFEEGGRS